MDERPLSRDELRAVDAWAAERVGLPTLVLMENAGRGAAEILLERLPPSGRVLVLCGPGNNGGDGGVVARHLVIAGVAVRVAWLAPPDRLSLDASTQFRVLKNLDVDSLIWDFDLNAAELDARLAGFDWLVDGLLGTGLTRPPEGRFLAAIEAMNRSGKPVLALDLPSGLDADSGRPLGAAVVASLTATFAAPKLGFSAAGANRYTGEVRVVPIGVPVGRMSADWSAAEGSA